MNRKQRVAVVVGVVVIVLLVLFPVWEASGPPGSDPAEGWVYRHGSAWIGSPPPSFREPYVVNMTGDLKWMIEGTEASTTDGPGRPKLLKVSIGWSQVVSHLVAALALTVAAVVVLKERKPTS